MKIKASLRRLILSNFKLDVLLAISQAINENLTNDELFHKFEVLLRNDLNIGKVVVFSYNNIKWECVLESGYKVNSATIGNLETEMLKYREITNIISVNHPVLGVFDVIIPVFHKDNIIAYVLIGDIEEEREGVSPTIKHLHFIQTLANLIIVAVENKRLFDENVKQEALKKELELASRMQTMLIPNPRTLPNNDRIHVSAYYLPHFEVGGDYYDFIRLSNTEYGFCIADVSGKGISAALLMSNFQANIRALFSANLTLKQTVEKLNERVMENANGEKFITLFIARYNSLTRELEYVNAGHNPPVFFDKEKNRVELLMAGCMGIGMFDTIPKITVAKMPISKGSKLICYTDGIAELENPDKQQFGTQPMETSVVKEQGINLSIDEIIEELEVYRGTNDYFDDISLMGIEFH